MPALALGERHKFACLIDTSSSPITSLMIYLPLFLLSMNIVWLADN